MNVDRERVARELHQIVETPEEAHLRDDRSVHSLDCYVVSTFWEPNLRARYRHERISGTHVVSYIPSRFIKIRHQGNRRAGDVREIVHGNLGDAAKLRVRDFENEIRADAPSRRGHLSRRLSTLEPAFGEPTESLF